MLSPIKELRDFLQEIPQWPVNISGPFPLLMTAALDCSAWTISRMECAASMSRQRFPSSQWTRSADFIEVRHFLTLLGKRTVNQLLAPRELKGCVEVHRITLRTGRFRGLWMADPLTNERGVLGTLLNSA